MCDPQADCKLEWYLVTAVPLMYYAVWQVCGGACAGAFLRYVRLVVRGDAARGAGCGVRCAVWGVVFASQVWGCAWHVARRQTCKS